MHILLTGFEPFGNKRENSSWAAAKEVAARGVYGLQVEQLPVSFSRVAGALRSAVERHRPEVIILLGQSGKAPKISLERVALNMMDSEMGDNDGFVPDEEPIDPEGQAALFTSLPIKRLRKAIEAEGVEAKVSNSAGVYVCNRAYYEALTLCKEQPHLRALFVHVPYFEGQWGVGDGDATMSIEKIIKAIQTLINNLTPNE